MQRREYIVHLDISCRSYRGNHHDKLRDRIYIFQKGMPNCNSLVTINSQHLALFKTFRQFSSIGFYGTKPVTLFYYNKCDSDISLQAVYVE